MSKKTEQSQPMDPSIRENVIPTPITTRERPCWAAKTLVKEVNELFPETPFEYSGRDGRGTALDVTFDLTVHDPMDRDALILLLQLTESDTRIDYTLVGEADGALLVSFKSNPRTQDSKAPFGLADALDVLDEDAEQ